jgi:hypothetical protein
MSPIRYRDIYIDLLPVFVPCTTFLGFITGLSSSYKLNPIDSFASIIGYTSLGLITGFSYPISYPLLTGYVLYKSRKD